MCERIGVEIENGNREEVGRRRREINRVCSLINSFFC